MDADGARDPQVPNLAALAHRVDRAVQAARRTATSRTVRSRAAPTAASNVRTRRTMRGREGAIRCQRVDGGDRPAPRISDRLRSAGTRCQPVRRPSPPSHGTNSGSNPGLLIGEWLVGRFSTARGGLALVLATG